MLGYTPFQAGIAFLPTTIFNFGAALAVTRLTRYLGGGAMGNGRLLLIGLLIDLVGMLWLAQVSADTTYLSGVALPMILLGIGQGFTLNPLTVAGITGVRAEDAGAASGMVRHLASNGRFAGFEYFGGGVRHGAHLGNGGCRHTRAPHRQCVFGCGIDALGRDGGGVVADCAGACGSGARLPSMAFLFS